MKFIHKFSITVVVLAALTGCTGTTYNKDRTCSEDYVIHPSLSVPDFINACDGYVAK